MVRLGAEPNKVVVELTNQRKYLDLLDLIEDLLTCPFLLGKNLMQQANGLGILVTEVSQFGHQIERLHPVRYILLQLFELFLKLNHHLFYFFDQRLACCLSPQHLQHALPPKFLLLSPLESIALFLYSDEERKVLLEQLHRLEELFVFNVL
jgi:hypothetical protein